MEFCSDPLNGRIMVAGIRGIWVVKANFDLNSPGPAKQANLRLEKGSGPGSSENGGSADHEGNSLPGHNSVRSSRLSSSNKFPPTTRNSGTTVASRPTMLAKVTQRR